MIREAISADPQRSLKGKDAVHLATAMSVNAAEIHTYDDKLHAYSTMVGVPVCLPRPQTPTLGSTSEVKEVDSEP